MLAEALDRMPHAGAMQLIAAIEHVDGVRICCLATDHASPIYPLRLHGTLYAAALVELGAQAAAAHASLFGMDAAHSGFVLTISDLQMHRDRIDDPEPLLMAAERLHQADGAAAYRFEVTQGASPIVTGEILLSMVRT